MIAAAIAATMTIAIAEKSLERLIQMAAT